MSHEYTLCHITYLWNAGAATETTSTSESLWEQFEEGLELASYFEGTMKGTPEYTEKVQQAKQTLDAALKASSANSFVFHTFFFESLVVF